MINDNSQKNIKKMVLAALFASLISVGAYIKIPLPFVPMTLQILFIFLAGSILGARWGALSVLVYLLIGIIGLPVFAGGASGPGVLMGPTGGYLIGFLCGTFITGLLSDKYGSKNILNNVLFMLTGLIVIYLIGTGYLMHITYLSMEKAFAVGVAPFIIVDIIKLIFASIIASKYSL